MTPWILLVSSSKYLNESYSEIKQHWTLGELVDHIHFHRGMAEQERAESKSRKRKLKSPRSKL